jgi:hypothetical protein
MDNEEQIKSLIALLEMQTKLHATAVDMLKPATEAAYQRGYNDAMGWKVQNHLEHLPSTTKAEWVGLTDEEFESIYAASRDLNYDYERAIEAKLKEKNT